MNVFDEVEAGSISPDGSRMIVDFFGSNGTTQVSLPAAEISCLINLSLRLWSALVQRTGADPSLPVMSCEIGAVSDGRVMLTFGLEGEAEIKVKVDADAAEAIAATIVDTLPARPHSALAD